MTTTQSSPSQIPPRSAEDQAEIDRIGEIATRLCNAGHTEAAELVLDDQMRVARAADIRACNRVANNLQTWIDAGTETDRDPAQSPAAGMVADLRAMAATLSR